MNMNEAIGRRDILFITLDTLRYDVAQEAWRQGKIPNLTALLPSDGWELRHTPGSFTFAAHAAFFAGFLPTPARPGIHLRPFALRFPGSETTDFNTAILEGDNLVDGLARYGYHTLCIGGVGFFNKQSPLGSLFPSYFHESHWSARMGVTDRDSTGNQVALAVERLQALPPGRRVFLFINVSALHQPNCMYLEGASSDNAATQKAALEYVDSCLPPLFACLEKRGPGFGVICSDHGTAYGEDGFTGHRLAHPVVWNVPYAEFSWGPRS